MAKVPIRQGEQFCDWLDVGILHEPYVQSLDKESVCNFKGRGGGVSCAISRLGKVLEVPADRWEAK